MSCGENERGSGENAHVVGKKWEMLGNFFIHPKQQVSKKPKEASKEQVTEKHIETPKQQVQEKSTDTKSECLFLSSKTASLRKAHRDSERLTNSKPQKSLWRLPNLTKAQGSEKFTETPKLPPYCCSETNSSQTERAAHICTPNHVLFAREYAGYFPISAAVDWWYRVFLNVSKCMANITDWRQTLQVITAHTWYSWLGASSVSRDKPGLK